MRKKIIVLGSILLALTLMGNSHANDSGIQLKNYPESAQLWEMLQLKSETELGEIVILPHAPFNQKEAAGIISRLDQLPVSILKKTNEAGIRIKLFTGKLTENPTASHLAGIMPRGYTKTTWDDVPGIGGSKTVLIKIGASQKGNGHSSVNLELHELAHSIDRYVLDEFRYNPDFIQIWHKESGRLFPGQPYFLTYPEEYFAECFAYYYLGGKLQEELKRKAPLTFQLIQDVS
ncbi:anthrax toxin lethal factor-related metalloendopeptidase [Bacillus benzoevorans]|uniref:ATLF-like domain-containing protein n=1 Tax=Bacillus benzoevorans TaxID=1456 RepID=A0A7X0HPR5_9BACI|nr:toxin [Bacillus benzoevorans]MBB6444603.1 hypothetical protein [Bacillus benzoevorans]